MLPQNDVTRISLWLFARKSCRWNRDSSLPLCLNGEKESFSRKGLSKPRKGVFFSEKEFGFCPFVLVRVRKWGFFLRKGFHGFMVNSYFYKLVLSQLVLFHWSTRTFLQLVLWSTRTFPLVNSYFSLVNSYFFFGQLVLFEKKYLR